jgi:DUF971 family protein
MSAAATHDTVWPLELRYVRERRVLEVDFDDGSTVSLPAELLRVESPSAEVRGHGGGQKTIVAGKRHVAISRIEPVGTYAARLVFDDGHDTGLYTWRYLHELAARQQGIWDAYLKALAARGLSRDG